MNQLLLDITPESPPTLDNFVVGRNSELLCALHEALSNSGGERCFYLWGEEGSGKSHLLRACIGAALAMQQEAIYACGNVPCMDTDATVIAVDDVERLDDDDAQIGLFNLYNRMRECGGMLIVGGRQSPRHLGLRDDLRTRLGWGMVYQVHGLSEEEKMQALMQCAGLRGFTLTQEVAQYLMRHGRRDLPSLMAVLKALDEHSLRLHRAPSVPLLKEVLQRELETK